MKAENKFTFLGASDAALSMFIEIIHSLHQDNFKLGIVQNIDVVQQFDYLIPNIQAHIYKASDWRKESDDHLLIGVNKSQNKQLVFDFFGTNHGVRFEDYSSLIHPRTSVATTAQLGNGVILNPGVTLAPFSRLGNLTTVNRNASVGHHTHLGEFCTIHPGVNIAGHCKISKGVTIGMGANVIDGISIGENSSIGAGSFVTKNVPPNVVAYGSPAKVIKEVN